MELYDNVRMGAKWTEKLAKIIFDSSSNLRYPFSLRRRRHPLPTECVCVCVDERVCCMMKSKEREKIIFESRSA